MFAELKTARRPSALATPWKTGVLALVAGVLALGLLTVSAPALGPATATRDLPAGLSVEALKNATYQSGFSPLGVVRLREGAYRAPLVPGSATMLTVQLTGHLAHGHLNGQEAAAVDPLCCPTHPEVRVYALQGDTLVPAVASDLVGIAWRWEGFLGGDDSKLVVDDPGKYTIEFLPTGSAAIRADCNTGRAPYRLGGPRLEIGPILLTRAACPPGSLGDRFVRSLADTVAYLVRDGRLILDVKLDTGQMRFSPARP